MKKTLAVQAGDTTVTINLQSSGAHPEKAAHKEENVHT